MPRAMCSAGRALDSRSTPPPTTWRRRRGAAGGWPWPAHLSDPALRYGPRMRDTEAPWRRRFRAASISLPSWARERPDRLLYASNASGKWELYAWDRERDTHRQVTDRPEGTMRGRIDPTGEWIWWFDDDKGNEFGRWVIEPFEGGVPEPAAPDLGPAYGA